MPCPTRAAVRRSAPWRFGEQPVLQDRIAVGWAPGRFTERPRGWTKRIAARARRAGHAASSVSFRVRAPRPVRRIVERLEEAGFETWTVGGAVRDSALGRLPTGPIVWDLATAARPEQVRGLFRRTVPLGVEYGTVGVFGFDGILHEVTTFRRDVATFGRKAVVEFGRSLGDDLARRDFTMNALAWHPLRRELRDPHGGRADMEAGVLRAVGDPSTRFREDYLRILRGFRFAGALGLRVESATWAGIVEAVPGLAHLSMERVREELAKALAGPAPSRALALYQESGALEQLLPELDGDAVPAALGAVDAAADRLAVRLAILLLHGLAERSSPAKTAAELLRRLRFSKAEIKRACAAMAGGPAPPESIRAGAVARRRWAAEIGPTGVRDVARVWFAGLRAGSESPGALEVVRRVRRDLHAGVPMSVHELAIGGGDLVAAGWPPSPAVGRALSRLLEAVWETPSANEPSRLLRLAADMRPAWPASHRR